MSILSLLYRLSERWLGLALELREAVAHPNVPGSQQPMHLVCECVGISHPVDEAVTRPAILACHPFDEASVDESGERPGRRRTMPFDSVRDLVGRRWAVRIGDDREDTPVGLTRSVDVF